MGIIVALVGRKKCGKSPTLKLVFEILKDKYKVPEDRLEHRALKGDDIKIIMDIEVMAEIKTHKIGIASQGDPGPYLILPQTLNDFENAGCDIIFCACRTRGATKNCIKAHTKYTHQFINQTILPHNRTEQQETESNKSKAQEMIRAADL
jgi:uncharacterized Zn ribbon protein